MVDVAALVFSGLLSFYGLLIWRVAWTREVPKSLWDAERGWRLRLVLALDQGVPTGRQGPAMIVFVWSMFLFLIARTLDADGAATVLGIAVLVALVHYGLVRVFTWPTFLIPPHARRRRGNLARRSRHR